MDNSFREQYLEACVKLAKDAGDVIMTYFAGQFTTRQKEDNSPVTDADVAANTLITKGLMALAPNIPIIAEEDEEVGATGHSLFWLVDPLDGTRSFVRGEEEFTVNIGLIHNGEPVMGIIYAPPQKTMYYGTVGQGAFKQVAGGKVEAIKVRTPSPDGLVVTRSRTSKPVHDYLSRFKILELKSGSSSIKFCQVAEGSADLYPRFGRTMEWDTAAGHAILKAAGGRVETLEEKPLGYGKAGYENPAFVAFGF